MECRWLYHTVVPVLLGDPSEAGRVASGLYSRHGLTPHWFGQGRGLLLTVYAERHPAPAGEDGVLLRLLLAFAKERPAPAGLLTLIPCSEEAEAFLLRHRETLEEHFVLLSRPAPHGEPLGGLVRA